MTEPFLGEIRMTGFNFPPRGWALCDGQLLSISQNTALFSLLGTTYGGDGRTTFALPDLRGRIPLHPDLLTIALGQAAGAETHLLVSNEMPSHTHAANATSSDPSTSDPAAGALAAGPLYASAGATAMNPSVIGAAGGSQPHNNQPPFLTINFVIALAGIFPSRS